MSIATIESTGLWVFDSNWGFGSDTFDAVGKGNGQYLKVGSSFIEISKATAQQKADAVESYNKVDDVTARYHFMSYALNLTNEGVKAKVKDATVYRINS